MRKVGIITLFDPENYGNRLQAYALAKTLQKMGCQVFETFRCNGFGSWIKGKIKTNRLLRMLLELYLSITVPDKGGLKNYRRVNLFWNFLQRAGVEQHRANDPRIDYYVCGSDQIWNPDLGGDGFYFANFAEKNKRVAYAASFGVETLPEKMAVDYTEYLKGMSHISVREHAGAALIKELVQKDVPVVVDPTMLLSREEWLPMMKKPTYPLKERFMLTYFLGGYSDDAQNYIKKVAQEHDLQIVSLNSMCKDCYWFGTGPSEFLWLIENAAVVCTNSFHGTVFSIIMNTPFINFRRGSKTNSMHSRIETLLRTMQLTGRVYGEVKEECLFDMDYQHVTGILESEKKRSIEYLRNALNLSDEANCLQ